MASKLTYEFHCPQYCDFSEVNSSPKDRTAFGGFSPDLGNAAPVLNARLKRSVQSKTHPVIKSTAPSHQTPANHPSNKWCISRVGLSKRLSKSDGSVNLCSLNLKPPTSDSSVFSLQKNRSFSENDLRPRMKKFPTTPTCLKRTLCRIRSKKLKTSEELELEKIAQLQKQMHQHLRANEIAMRRLKIKTKPCTAKKEWTKTDVRSKDNFRVNVPIVSDHKIWDRLNGCRQNTRPSGTQERNGIKEIFTAKRVTNHLSELQKNTARELSENKRDPKSETDKLIKNKCTPYVAHSGLAYLTSQKVTTCKPFNFTSTAMKTGLSLRCKAEKEYSTKDQIKMQIPRSCSKLAGKENKTFQTSFSDVNKAKNHRRKTPFHFSIGKEI